MSELFIGLMSGTSMDAVDAVLVDFAIPPLQLLATYSEPMPHDLKKALLTLAQPSHDEIQRLGQLDIQVGLLFAQTCHGLLQQAGVAPSAIRAIGSHGQTVRHQPHGAYPFTLQIGDPNVIAQQTGITTVADFRRRDIAVGGQGAPLVPAFHAFVLRSPHHNRAVLNIGGIANVTLLPVDERQAVIGFDTGPGNTLLDAWTRQHLPQEYDKEGQWGASGQLQPALLTRLLDDAYFQRPPPKSTGCEYFNLTWLQAQLQGYQLAPADVQSTLVELTACSIMRAIHQFGASIAEILVCGGGVHNKYLLQRLAAQPDAPAVYSTQTYGIDPAGMEAMAFAWLAKQTLAGQPGNLPSVTGAKQPVVLGGIYAG